MYSINQHIVKQRIAHVWDVMAGSQATHKGIKDYVKALRNAVKLKDEDAGDGEAFMRDFGAGI